MRIILLLFLVGCTSVKFNPAYYAVYEKHHITGNLRRIDFDDIHKTNTIKIYKDSIIYNGICHNIKSSNQDVVSKMDIYYFEDGTQMVFHWKNSGTIALFYNTNGTIIRMANSVDDL